MSAPRGRVDLVNWARGAQWSATQVEGATSPRQSPAFKRRRASKRGGVLRSSPEMGYRPPFCAREVAFERPLHRASSAGGGLAGILPEQRQRAAERRRRSGPLEFWAKLRRGGARLLALDSTRRTEHAGGLGRGLWPQGPRRRRGQTEGCSGPRGTAASSRTETNGGIGREVKLTAEAHGGPATG
jgi:hypothetical protein